MRRSTRTCVAATVAGEEGRDVAPHPLSGFVGRRMSQAAARIDHQTRWRPAPELVAGVMIILLAAGAALAGASARIDGVRYFWLDDDMMISMRYSRNLAEGHGLVFNPGERVEGYSNFLWVAVLALVHLLSPGDARAAAAVVAINACLAIGVLLAGRRLLAGLGASSRATHAAFTLALAVCVDLLYWSANGFETTLLTLLFTAIVCRLVRAPAGEIRRGTALLLAALPLVRADGLVHWAAAALPALALSPRRSRDAMRLAASLLPAGMHLAFRLLYYGEWLPNTAHLKVLGVEGKALQGAGYLARFVLAYALPLAFAGASIVLRATRQKLALLACAGTIASYVVAVGGDNFPHARFLAPLVPLLLALAFAGVEELVTASRLRTTLAGAVALAVFAFAGIHRPADLRSVNGGPEQGTVTGVLISRHTSPGAVVAVVAAGAVPYFSRRATIDLLGKVDPVLAHRAGAPGVQVGHSKYAPEVSFARRPDLVVLLGPPANVRRLVEHSDDPAAAGNYNAAIVLSEEFRRDYLGQPSPLPYLQQHGSVYARRDSPEAAALVQWVEPRIGG